LEDAEAAKWLRPPTKEVDQQVEDQKKVEEPKGKFHPRNMEYYLDEED
jgi:hypothetical protein